MTARNRQDRLASGLFFLIGVPATLIVPAMAFVLFGRALEGDFLSIAPLLLRTVKFAAAALGISLLPGTGAALYASEFLPPRSRRRAALLFEGLGALPPVCCAWAAVTFLPILRGPAGAGLAISGFLAPKLAARTFVLLHRVPISLREASLTCGASRLQTIRRVVLPAVLPGFGLTLLELFTWVMGETMVLLVLCGSATVAPWNAGTLGTVSALGLPATATGTAAEATLVWPAALLLVFSVLSQLPGLRRNSP